MSIIGGAGLDWLAHRDLGRDQLRELIVAALPGALAAAADRPEGPHRRLYTRPRARL